MVVIVVVLGGAIVGMFTRVGSGINHHPHNGSDGSPGAKGTERDLQPGPG